jgi:hypothetical protein
MLTQVVGILCDTSQPDGCLYRGCRDAAVATDLLDRSISSNPLVVAAVEIQVLGILDSFKPRIDYLAPEVMSGTWCARRELSGLTLSDGSQTPPCVNRIQLTFHMVRQQCLYGRATISR